VEQLKKTSIKNLLEIKNIGDKTVIEIILSLKLYYNDV